MVDYERRGSIAFLTLNDGERRNPLSSEMIEGLYTGIGKAEEDPSVRAIVIQGAGKVFSAGADLSALSKMQSATWDENVTDISYLSSMFSKLYHCSKLTIALVHGAAVAGGFGLATICDYIIADPATIFCYSEVKIGFIPALVSVYLVRKIGEARSRHLLLSGHNLSTSQLLEYGLVHKEVSRDEQVAWVQDFVETWAKSTSPEAVKATKALLAKNIDLPLVEALTNASIANADARMSADCKRGVRAFLDKETVDWTIPSK